VERGRARPGAPGFGVRLIGSHGRSLGRGYVTDCPNWGRPPSRQAGQPRTAGMSRRRPLATHRTAPSGWDRRGFRSPLHDAGSRAECPCPFEVRGLHHDMPVVAVHPTIFFSDMALEYEEAFLGNGYESGMVRIQTPVHLVLLPQRRFTLAAWLRPRQGRQQPRPKGTTVLSGGGIGAGGSGGCSPDSSRSS
jgi:hypothetical protein